MEHAITPRRIAVVGLWHLGSVLTACWADVGHRVVGADRSPDVIDALQSGRAPVFEPGLDALLQQGIAAGRLSFTTDVAAAAADCDVLFLAFDTPVDAKDNLNLAPLEAALREAAPRLPSGAVVVVSSQVPVGTCASWRTLLRALRGASDVEIGYSPENLRLGEAIARYARPDRIVVGADDAATRQRIAELFAPMRAPVQTTSLASAEMIKHAINGFLATSISFINEIADLCEISGADVQEVVAGLKSDERIGARAALNPGLGFAGGTLGRDVQVLRGLGRNHARPTPLLDAALAVNAGRPSVILRRLQEECGDLRGLRVGAWGLTYKPGTSTLRRSTAIEVVDAVVGAGATVRAYDPKADLTELGGAPNFLLADDAYGAATGATAVLLLTEWPEFATLDFARVREVMARPLIVDARNFLANQRLDQHGFRYLRIGL